MRIPLFSIALLLAATCVVIAPVRAENEGQGDLDKAMELKLSAESLNDLGEVINLCRSSLAAGLDDANKEFAQKLLVGSLEQRAEVICAQVFDQSNPPPQWPLLRRQALLDLEEAAKLDEKQAQIHFMIGRLEALPGGNRDRAVKALDAAIELQKEDPNDCAKSLVLRANLTEEGDKRVALYDEAVKLAPKDADAIRTRGLYYLMEKNYDKALADIDAAIELEPEHADSQEARGVILFLTNNYDEAMKSFDRAVELQPKAAMAYTHRARIYAIKDQDAKAMAELDKALELEPKSVTALVLRARLKQQADKKDEALEDVNAALQISPADPQALQVRAILLAGSGKFGDAITDLQQLRREEPDNIELLMQLGLFYSADKQPRKAIETFSSVLTKDANNLQALRNRGDSWLAMGKAAEAIADYELALKVDEKDSGVLNNLAWLLSTAPVDGVRNGKRAVDLAKEAARITEFKQAHILSTLAASYAETGDFESAVTWSKKAVELGDKSGEKEIASQLHKELESYQAKKPWREKLGDAASNDPEPEELPQPPTKPAPDANASGSK